FLSCCVHSRGQAIGSQSAPKLAPPENEDETVSALTSPESLDLSKTLEDHLAPIIERAERQYFDACLKANRGRIGDTAKQAGIHRRTLLRKINQYKIDKSVYKN
ncbi:MAG: helix-turn-helix domain-containing protein, partial [Planctomycetota bacterium]|nr:helix-turn-helix domain-containing protein [Planctomycetota bacterium]